MDILPVLHEGRNSLVKRVVFSKAPGLIVSGMPFNFIAIPILLHLHYDRDDIIHSVPIVLA